MRRYRRWPRPSGSSTSSRAAREAFCTLRHSRSTPWRARAAKFVEAFTEAAQEAGLIVWPNVGHADGVNGDLVVVAPPFIITEQEIDELVTRFTAAHAAALRAVKAGVR